MQIIVRRRSCARGAAVLFTTLLAGTSLPALAQVTQPPAQTAAPTGGDQPTQAQADAANAPPAPSSDVVPQNPPAAAESNTAPGVGGVPQPQAAQPASSELGQQENQTDIVVTGYRQSLQSATDFKRNATGFVDSIFAEDIGKFPDTNIAETFNRIPGITIVRDNTGEGVNVAIRGLGPNFTNVTLNGAPIAVASTGTTDAQGTNREVDLNLFPIELFTQLTVNKSARADQLEGGVAGNVDMRSARPFDNPGTHLTYSVQAEPNTNIDGIGERGSAIFSTTHGKFGILAGFAGFRDKVNTTGYETIGYTNPNLTAAQCGAGNTCNTTGGGNFTIPSTVPAGVGNGLTAGTPIDEAFLLANNPGATIQQIDNGLLPRLGRPSDEFGTKGRVNAILSMEYRPSESLHLYVDGMYGKEANHEQRIDMDWVGRNGAIIPLNTTYDTADCANGCTVTGGTYANSQFFLEYRPYIEHTEFWGVNPGGTWTINHDLKLDLQGNYTHSTFHRESPSVVVSTNPNAGVTVTYANNGDIPSIDSSIDLDDPSNFGWYSGSRVNIQDERRTTETKGVRGDLTWGDERLSLKVGGAYDDISRNIMAFDNSQAWQNAVCGDNPSVFVPSPNSQPPCAGLDQAGAAPAGYPTYPAYGTGYTAGMTGPVTYGGSLVPMASVPSFLQPGPDGFVTLNYNDFINATNYNQYHDNEPSVGAANTGASGGSIDEKDLGLFAEVNGDLPIGDNTLDFNAGVRYVHTDQTVGGQVSLPDPRNNTAAGTCPLTDKSLDGSCYPNIVNEVTTSQRYHDWLPSASAAFHIGDHAVARAAVSRTITRPDPSAQLPGLNFSTPSADVGTVGNSALQPYLSTNIDVGFEYYTGKEGYVGVTAFRKAVTGFTVNGNTTEPFSALAQYGVTYDTLTPTQQAAINSRGGPDEATVVLQEQVNAPGTLKVNGLEFDWVQPLDFLLGRYLGLNGFGFNANLTLVDQHGTGSAPAVATGVAPVTYNLTGYYEGHGLTVRLSTVFNKGSQASGLNQNGIPAAAIFTSNYQQFDLSSSYDLSKLIDSKLAPEITFDVINLTDAKQRAYWQFENATFTEYDPGTTFLVGFRGKF